MNKKRCAAMAPPLLALVVLVVLIGVYGTACAAAPVHEGFLSPAVSAQVVGDTLYAVSEGRIIAFAQPEQAPETVLDLSGGQGIESRDWEGLRLASDGAALYLINSVDGRMYAVEGGALRQIVQLDFSALGEPHEEGGRHVLLDYPVLMGASLYLLHTDLSSYERALWRFSLKSGKGEMIDTDQSYLTGIAPYRQERLLAADSAAGSLIVLEPATGATVSILGPMPGHDGGAAAYDEAGGQIYFISGAKLMRPDKRGAQALAVLPLEGAVSVKYAGMWQGLYTVLDDASLYAFSTSAAPMPAPAGKALTILIEQGYFPDQDILRKYMIAHPDTSIETLGERDENVLERLITANLSRDGAVDIFVISSSWIDSKDLFKRGYAAALQSETLEEDVRSMYPQVQDYLSEEGALLAYPLYMYPLYWSYRPELLSETGLGPVPETFDEYIDMALSWYEQYGDSSPDYTFDGSKTAAQQQISIISRMITQYVLTHASQEGPLVFNTPVFHSALEKLSALSRWKEASPQTAVSEEAVYGRSIFDQDAMSPWGRQINPEHEGEACILPPVFVKGEQPVLGAALEYMIVNPHGPNREEALKFLEFFIDNRDLASKYMLHPAYNEPVETDRYQFAAENFAEDSAMYQRRIADTEELIKRTAESQSSAEYQQQLYALQDALALAEAKFAQEEKTRWVYTAPVIEEYRSLAPYISLEHRTLLYAMIDLDADRILSKYFEGSATIDQVLSELDRRVAMMYYEGQ